MISPPKIKSGGVNQGKHYSDGLAIRNDGLLFNINNSLGSDSLPALGTITELNIVTLRQVNHAEGVVYDVPKNSISHLLCGL